jgi:hypothetical protein
MFGLIKNIFIKENLLTKEIILYLKIIKNGEAILSYEQVFNAKEV